MALPNVNITLGNGSLGGSQATSDGVVGLILTGTAVTDGLQLNTAYVLGSANDLTTLGVTSENNPLVYKDVMAFYTKAGDGAELHLYVVAATTTYQVMAGILSTSPLSVLLDSAGARIKLVGLNKLPSSSYEADDTNEIDKDVILGAEAAQATLESYAGKIMPARCLIGASFFTGNTDNLYKPAEASYNRVGLVLASDDSENYTAAIGQLLGRAAAVDPQISIARVSDGSLATEGWLTSGDTQLSKVSIAEILHDAGYIFYVTYPTKTGVYLNDDRMAVPMTDDYVYLNRGRIIDKALSIVYSTYIDKIQSNISVDSDGNIPQAVASDFESTIENAISSQMSDQISDFEAYVDPAQNVLSTGNFAVVCNITPQGTLKAINVTLGFINPSLS